MPKGAYNWKGKNKVSPMRHFNWGGAYIRRYTVYSYFFSLGCICVVLLTEMHGSHLYLLTKWWKSSFLPNHAASSRQWVPAYIEVKVRYVVQLMYWLLHFRNASVKHHLCPLMYIQAKCFNQPVNKVNISTMRSTVQQRPIILQMTLMAHYICVQIVHSDNP